MLEQIRRAVAAVGAMVLLLPKECEGRRPRKTDVKKQKRKKNKKIRNSGYGRHNHGNKFSYKNDLDLDDLNVCFPNQKSNRRRYDRTKNIPDGDFFNVHSSLLTILITFFQNP